MNKSSILEVRILSKIVLDTSVIINGQITKQVESGTIVDSEIIIPAAVAQIIPRVQI